MTDFRDKIIALTSQYISLQKKITNTNDTPAISKVKGKNSLLVIKNGLNDRYKQTVSAALPQTFHPAAYLTFKL